VKIDHIALYVRDLDAVKDFFVNYFGASANDKYRNTMSGFQSYYLTFDDGGRMELMSKPRMSDLPKDPVRTGYHHVAFNLGSEEAVDAMSERLKADGYQILSGPRITGDGYYESCILDREGNQIEITV
jgi:lactoylglutathione lyase